VVDHLLALRHVSQVSIVGWVAGGPRTGGYAAQNPGKVAKLVLLAPAYVREAAAKPPAQVPAAGAAMNVQSHDDFNGCGVARSDVRARLIRAVSDADGRLLLSDPVGPRPGVRACGAPRR